MRMGPEAAKRAVQKAMQAAEEVWQRRAAKNEPIDTKQLLSGLETATQAVANWAAFNVPALRWVAVMLVSYLEVYLEDVLIGIARKHSRIIKKLIFRLTDFSRSILLKS